MPRKSAAVRRKTVSEARTRSSASESATGVVRSRSAKPARLREDFRSFARVAILTAAEEVLAEEGLHAARIEEIAQRARVAVGTIYNLVGDRNALIQEIMHARHAEVLALLVTTLKTHKQKPFREQVYATALVLFNYFGSHSRFFRLVLESEPAAESGKLGPAARSKQATMIEIHKLLGELIQRGVKQGSLRATGSELYPAMLGGLLRGVMMHDVLAHELVTPESRAEQVTRMFLEGAGT
jgi:TetR/AcrR family transcriptional regulator